MRLVKPKSIEPLSSAERNELTSLILANIRLDRITGCWLWLLVCFKDGFKDGYGRIQFRKRSHKAHRIAFLVFIGDIPEGMCVLHHCDVPNCCNPDHLFLGTNEDNVAAMVAKGRQAKGEKNGMFGRTGEKAPMFGKGYLIAGEKNPWFGKTGDKHPAFGKGYLRTGEKNGMFGRTGERILALNCGNTKSPKFSLNWRLAYPSGKSPKYTGCLTMPLEISLEEKAGNILNGERERRSSTLENMSEDGHFLLNERTKNDLFSRLTDFVLLANRSILEFYGKPDSCVFSTGVICDTLRAQGLKAEPLRVTAAVFPDRQDLFACVLGSDGDGERRAAAAPGGWWGHLVTLVADRFVLDSTLDQVNDHHPHLKATPVAIDLTETKWFTAPTGPPPLPQDPWTGLLPLFPSTLTRYSKYPLQRGWKSAGDWRRKKDREEMVKRLLRRE
jgi:hypothetical protein